jgi:trimethylamine:corrinoid methyltransferase-like protein
MIQTNSTKKQSPLFRMLADDQIKELIRAAFEVMEKVEFKVLHPDAGTMLKKAGAKDTATRVREKIRQILETHRPQALGDKTLNSEPSINRRIHWLQKQL